jgi:hypothetical protein
LGAIGVFRFEDPEENIGHECLHLVLDVVFKLVAHDQKHLLANVGDLGTLGHAVFEKGNAPVLGLDQLYEFFSVAKDRSRTLNGPSLEL